MVHHLSSHGFFRRPISAWLIAFGGTALGIWLQLDSDTIGSTSRAVFVELFSTKEPVATQWVPGSIGFWIACVVWATLVFFRLRSDDYVSETRILNLIRAINRAPDASVVLNYPSRYFQPSIRALGPFLTTTERGKDAIAQKIVEALQLIALMAKDFARRPEASYGANIMLAASPEQFDLIRANMNLRFHDARDLGSLRAILYSRKALCVSSCSNSAPRTVPEIALPVPEVLTRNNRTLAIPGAPRTLLGGAPGVHIDAWKLHEDCEDLAGAIQDEIKTFFSENGEGQDIRSFASFRLGTEGENPIGILNIDSNQTGILGTEADYYPTFHALIEPIMAALAVNVQEYARMDFASLQANGADLASIPTPDEGHNAAVASASSRNEGNAVDARAGS